MNIAYTKKASTKTPCTVIFAFDEKNKKKSGLPTLSTQNTSAIKRAQDQISYSLGSTTNLPLSTGSKSLIIIVGLGEKKEYTYPRFLRAVRAGTRAANAAKQKHAQFLFPELDLDSEQFGFIVGLQTTLALYAFASYKKGTKKTPNLSRIDIVSSAGNPAALRKGKILGEETNAARELSNIPGGDMTPTLLANHAVHVGKKAGILVTVFDKKKIESLGMGAVLGVARGSSEEPKFITMEYTHPNAKKEKPFVLVGKGVTFDTGGLNIKPDTGMYEMHLDMAGGASVIHALIAIARLKLPVRVVALIPAVENMPGSAGYRPGDILKSYSGKTIEVKHTDAEGRLILADALSYAKKFSPKVVIDVATLTGAAVVALGQRTSAILSPDQDLQRKLIDAGEKTGDRVWPLPLWPEYKADMECDFADIANMSKVKYGGTITAGAFLWAFAPISAWAHIDIAPTMTAIPEDNLSPGAKGSGVCLLTQFISDSIS